MCGIAGWARPDYEVKGGGLIQAMTDMIAHRGPDDEGFYLGPGISLGHRRLSVIDLIHGSQPMVSPDGRYVVVYNGEVYNYQRLKAQLEALGCVFFTQSDTEVLLTAFIQWGPDCFARFEGMFALGIWDCQESCLYLARDHMGIKPLYYSILNNELIFASEIKALLCHPGLERAFDPKVMACFLAFNNIFGPQCLWHGVRRLHPGEYLRWQKGEASTERFFDVGTVRVDPFQGTFEEAAEEYSSLLKNSVRDHLISDVPLGSNLSGGIDSASVASLAAGWHGEDLPVFTGYFVGHENGWFDERPGSFAVARQHGMQMHQCPIREDDFRHGLRTAAYHLDEPTLGSGAVPQYIVAGIASKKVKVVLTGHGGDELFAGYPIFKSSFLRECREYSCLKVRGMDELARMAYFLLGGIINPVLAKGQFNMFSQRALQKIAGPVVREALNDVGGNQNLFTRFQPFDPSLDVDGATRWYIATYLQTLLLQEDKIAMAHGLEGRVPICYPPILKLALSLPGRLKLWQGKLKAIPRQGMASDLPDILFRMPKRGFPTPIVHWLAGTVGKAWQDEWRSGLPMLMEGYIDPQEVLNEFNRFKRFGKRLPNAYPLAHRLVSLQMLFYSAGTLDGVKKVSLDSLPRGELKGSMQLGANEQTRLYW